MHIPMLRRNSYGMPLFRSPKKSGINNYAPVFGVKDETILAIYSHMIGYPLYLSAYAFGQIIEFQLERYLQGKDFAAEVNRIFKQGCLTPAQWMQEATGEPLTVTPLLEAVRKVLK